MDFWGIFMFFLLTFLIMSCCGYCCTSKRRGTVLSTNNRATDAALMAMDATADAAYLANNNDCDNSIDCDCGSDMGDCCV
ncbi:uncharacterized protein LOC111605150 isoform X8 [Drosophila hydei]|uniref:Uncharacterized protein LOC111605150 isoform X8 n=1 Tax=Drosophila hydei TaxID=7224 RepID=A0A6J1MQR8_DROHY|nr:uncharacterized protein LOC111605150 isoform X8 [Drosophila hydei]